MSIAVIARFNATYASLCKVVLVILPQHVEGGVVTGTVREPLNEV
jgi:hypothetical protein